MSCTNRSLCPVGDARSRVGEERRGALDPVGAREAAASCGGDERYDGWPRSKVGDACAIDGVA